MNIRLHELAECFVHHSVALKGVRSLKSFRHDTHLEMPATVPGPRVAGMQVALVGDGQFLGGKGRFEARSDLSDSFCIHGRVLITGLTSTPAKTPSIR